MGMQSIILAAISTAPNTGAVSYNPPQSSPGYWSATENQALMVFPMACTVDYFRVLQAAAPGAGKSYAYTHRLNSTSQTLVATVADTNVTNSDITHSYTAVAGDTLSILCTPSGTPAATGIMSLASRITANSTNQSILFFNTASNQQAANTTLFWTAMGDRTGNANELNRAMEMPTAGTLAKLYIVSDVDPGTMAQSVTVTLMKNGVATALVATINTGSTSANDTSDTISFVAADTYSVKIVTSLTCAAIRISGGMVFAPTTDGECLGDTDLNLQAQATTRFMPIAGGGGSLNLTESNRVHVMIACSVKKLYTFCNTNVGGSGQTLISTVRKNSANGTVTDTINSGSATANDTTNIDTFADNDTLDVQSITSATTGTMNLQQALVFYIAPANIFPDMWHPGITQPLRLPYEVVPY